MCVRGELLSRGIACSSPCARLLRNKKNGAHWLVPRLLGSWSRLHLLRRRRRQRFVNEEWTRFFVHNLVVARNGEQGGIRFGGIHVGEFGLQLTCPRVGVLGHNRGLEFRRIPALRRHQDWLLISHFSCGNGGCHASAGGMNAAEHLIAEVFRGGASSVGIWSRLPEEDVIARLQAWPGSADSLIKEDVALVARARYSCR